MFNRHVCVNVKHISIGNIFTSQSGSLDIAELSPVLAPRMCRVCLLWPSSHSITDRPINHSEELSISYHLTDRSGAMTFSKYYTSRVGKTEVSLGIDLSCAQEDIFRFGRQDSHHSLVNQTKVKQGDHWTAWYIHICNFRQW